MSPEEYEEGMAAVERAEAQENDEFEDYLDAVQFGPVPEAA